jgi:hypothetical protein
MKRTILAILALLINNLHAAAPESNLPKVLIIGDSISIGYTPFVIEMMEGKAVVTHHKGNAGPSIRGIENIDDWLGDEKWAVIHFNWGLWDMYGWRYIDQDRTPATYGKNLETLVQRLEKTGAKLIWATTTPACPAPEKKCKVDVDPATEREYLETALRVMKRHNIQVNDLHALVAPIRTQYALADDDVHYTQAGYLKIAEQVAEKIKASLPRE